MGKMDRFLEEWGQTPCGRAFGAGMDGGTRATAAPEYSV